MKMLKKFKRSIIKRVTPDPDRFLKKVAGVIHVGANEGQERFEYEKRGVDVIWIEPITEIFEKLQRNIEHFPSQKAYQCLVSDKDGVECTLNVASNNGASSSVLEFDKHSEVWPEIEFTTTLTIESITLDTFVSENAIDLSHYQALIIDTQGAELLVLKGAMNVLSNFEFIQVEVADFSPYRGSCTYDDLNSFLAQYGFKECSRKKFPNPRGTGNYFDVVFQRHFVSKGVGAEPIHSRVATPCPRRAIKP